MINLDNGLFSNVMESITLWKFNKITGFWKPERVCDRDAAQQWLEMYQKDEPNEKFKLSKTKPR